MRNRRGSMAGIVAMFVLLSAGLALYARPAQGDVHYVSPGECIQDAVDAADFGDTVQVNAGEYHQSVTFTSADSGIVLKGSPGAILDGDLPADDACTIAKDAVILTSGVHDVTITDFEIRDWTRFAPGSNGEGNAIQAWNYDASGTYNIVVKNNVMHNLNWNAVLVGNEGTGLHENWLIEWNTVYDYGYYGLELTNANNSVIRYNDVHHYGVDDAGLSTGILIQARNFEGGTVTVGGVEVYGNFVSDYAATELGYGIYLLAWSTAYSAILETAKVYDNEVWDATRGIQLNGADSGLVQDSWLKTNGVHDLAENCIQLNNADDNVVSGNEISNCGTYGIRLRSDSDGNTISENDVDYSGTADVSILDSDAAIVEQNNLGGSPKGIFVEGTSGSTEIDSNFIEEASYGVYVVVSGTSTHITANDVYDSSVDGIYVKATATSPDVEISGNTLDTTGGAGIYVESTQEAVVSDNFVWDSGVYGIFATGSTGLDVEYNFVDDGDGIAGCARLYGIFFQDSSGTVSYNEVTNIKHNPFCTQSWGVWIKGTSTVTIDHNLITDWEKGGIVAGSVATLGDDFIDATITYNEIIGSGDLGLGYAAQNGIQMGDGTTGSASHNTVEDVFYTGPDWSATGILLVDAGDGIEVAENQLTNTQAAINNGPFYTLGSSDSANIHDNTISESTWGIVIQEVSDNIVSANSIGAMKPTTGWQSYGIEVVTDTDSEILDNDVSGGYEIGIAVEESSQGTFVHGNSVSGDFRTGFLVDDSGSDSRITVDSNTVIGTSGGISYSSPLTGILIRDSSADASYNSVTGIKGTTIDKKQIAIALDGTTDANILYNTVSDYGKGGIYAGLTYDGWGDDSVSADIQYNLVIGTDYVTFDTPLNGIVTVDGTIGNVAWNTVRDNRNSYYDDYWVGPTACGILDYLSGGVRIENNTVDGNQNGIVLYGGDSQVFWNRVMNSQWGIVLEYGTDGAIVGFNTVVSQSAISGVDRTGILIADDDSSLITTNTVSSYDRGISIIKNPIEAPAHGSTNTMVRNNTISLAADEGMRITDSTGVVAFYNVIRNGNDDGVHVQDSGSITLHHNHVRDNSHSGIVLDAGVTTSVVDHNTVTGNHGDSGIWVRGHDNQITYNTVGTNGYGISVEGYLNSVERNTVNGNDYYGIWAVSGSHDNTFTRNTARNNPDGDCVDQGTNNHWVKNNCKKNIGLSMVDEADLLLIGGRFELAMMRIP